MDMKKSYTTLLLKGAFIFITAGIFIGHYLLNSKIL